MSRALANIKLFDNSSWNNATKTERFQMVLMDVRLEEQLTGDEWRIWTNVQHCFALCHKQFDTRKAIKVIQSQIPGYEVYTTAATLYRTMCEVYGPFQARNKEMARSIMVQRLWTIGVRLEQKGELEAAASVFEKAAKLEGLDKHDVELFDPSQVQIPIPIISNNPKYLNAEDAEVEDEEEEDDED